MSRPVVVCIDAVCGRCHTAMMRLCRMPTEGPEAFGSQRERGYTASHTARTLQPPGLLGPPPLAKWVGLEANADASCHAISCQQGGTPCTHILVSPVDICWGSR
jgi:hypothetical protein